MEYPHLLPLSSSSGRPTIYRDKGKTIYRFSLVQVLKPSYYTIGQSVNVYELIMALHQKKVLIVHIGMYNTYPGIQCVSCMLHVMKLILQPQHTKPTSVHGQGYHWLLRPILYMCCVCVCVCMCVCVCVPCCSDIHLVIFGLSQRHLQHHHAHTLLTQTQVIQLIML